MSRVQTAKVADGRTTVGKAGEANVIAVVVVGGKTHIDAHNVRGERRCAAVICSILVFCVPVWAT